MERPKYNQEEIDMNQLSPEAQKEHLANVSGSEQTDAFVRKVDQRKKDIMLPPFPKPGEIIRCQICGKPMPPEAFSKIPSIRKREFKWHIHNDCMNSMFDLVDRSTPGLMAERGRK